MPIGPPRRNRWLLPALAGTLLVAAVASLMVGAVAVSPAEVLSVIGRRIGLGGLSAPPQQADAVVWGIRMPRVLLGAVVGAVLALGGGALQGMLRNALADPHLLGIGPGAAIGGAIGAASGGTAGAIAGGVVTGVATALVVRRLAGAAAIDRTRIILSGVALGLALSAWVGFLVFAADRATVPPIEFWLLGSLTGATWRATGTVLIAVAIPCAGMVAARRVLDLMALGEAEARHLGVDTGLVGTLLLVAVGVAVGATVGAVGVVAFIGLLVPFTMRRAVGPSHRRLLPASLLGGALFLVVADLVARTALSPVEVPVGLVTAAVGGPVLLWMVARRPDA